MNTIDKQDKFVMRSYGRQQLAIESGSGFNATGEDGGEYIDFGSGVGVNSLGYCDSDWVEAVTTQLKKLQHISNYYYTETGADFAEKLCAYTGYANLFYGNSGAEANECAIKLARKYSFDKYANGNPDYGRYHIITLTGSFHGRTLATLSATGQDKLHNYFYPFADGFVHAEANNAADLAQKLDGSVCAVMLEYIQGEGGVNVLEQGFVDEIYRLCAAKDILVIADEIQTGAGRTGKFLCGEHYGKKADIVTMAKGIGAGLPVGICLAGEKCADVLTAGTHGSTFGGNPVILAGASVVLDKIANETFLTGVEEKGNYIREKLSKLPEVAYISGKGLMLGLSLKTLNPADAMKSALDKGLLVLTANDKLRLLPPLSIGYAEIDKGLNILREILS